MTAQPHTAGHLAARDSAQHPCPAPQTETFPPRAGGIPERGFLVCSGWWAWGRVFSAVTGGDNGIARKEGWASGPQPPKPWTVTPWWPALQQCQNTRKGELDPWRFLERRQPEGADRLRTAPSAECRGRDRSWRAVLAAASARSLRSAGRHQSENERGRKPRSSRQEAYRCPCPR